MDPDSLKVWLPPISRLAQVVISAGVTSTTLAGVPILKNVVGWGMKEVIDHSCSQLSAKLQKRDNQPHDVMLEDHVGSVLEGLDIHSDKPAPLNRNRGEYELLGDMLANWYLARARELQGLKCEGNGPELRSADFLKQKIIEQCNMRTWAIVTDTARDENRSDIQGGKEFTGDICDLQLEDLMESDPAKQTPGRRRSGSVDLYERAERFFQHGRVVKDVRQVMASTCNIGIIGMGGIGKTALAIEVFEEAVVVPPESLAADQAVGDKFHKKVWLNVTSQPNFPELLESAFRQLFDRPGKTHKLPFVREQSTRGLRDLVLRVNKAKMRVLLVLDDVWLSMDHSVVAKLNFVTRPEWDVHGSRLIITTRQRSVLFDTRHKLYTDSLKILQVPPLSRDSSWQLFEHRTNARYLYQRNDGDPDPHPFSNDERFFIKSLIDELDGNARAMVDLGERIGDAWKEMSTCTEEVCRQGVIACVKKYRVKLTDANHGPCDKASKRCKESVAASTLSPSLRDCFAAFAAFRRDEQVPESVVLHLFATHCPLHAPRAVEGARRKLEYLVDSSLVREHGLTDGGQLMYSMHRILHRIAAWMAKQACEYRETRVCHFQFTPDPEVDIKKVRYLSAHVRPTLDLITSCGNPLPQLRACILRNVHRYHSFVKPVWPSHLRFMYLRGAVRVEPETLQQAVSRANLLLLRFLCLAGSTETDAIIKAILPGPYLEHLNLSGCTGLEAIPDAIGECKRLTHLDLSGCTGLTTLHNASKAHLPVSLAHLNLSGCTELKQLPRLETRNKLTHLDLSECQVAELRDKVADIIYKCTKLVSLRLASCAQLTQFPELDKIGDTLQRLDLKCCTGLRELPPDVDNCKMLAQLVLRGCCNLERLPRSISKCTNLSHLDLHGCTALAVESVSEAMKGCKQLMHLDLSGWPALKCVPDWVLSLTRLSHLDLSNCTKLEAVPDAIGGFEWLAHLNLSGCVYLHKLPHTPAVRLLVEELSNNADVDSVRFLFTWHTFSLAHFNLSGCTALSEMPNLLPHYNELTHLDLSGCSSPQLESKLPEIISSCTRLVCLRLACTKVTTLPWLEDGIILQHLDLAQCEKLEELPDTINLCEQLTRLDLDNCCKLVKIPPITGCTNLSHLGITACAALFALPTGLHSCTSLTRLDLGGCIRLAATVTSAATREVMLMCTQLVHLSLRGWEWLPDYFLSLPHLVHLDLGDCIGLVAVPEELSTCTLLTLLNLSGCTSLTMGTSLLSKTSPGAGLPTSLMHLDLSDCTTLPHMPKMQSSHMLTHLNLAGCTTLEKSVIADATAMWACTQLTQLMHLNLHGWSMLEELPGCVYSCKRLTHLDLSDCTNLKLSKATVRMCDLKYLNISRCPLMYSDLPECIQTSRHIRLIAEGCGNEVSASA